VKRGLRRPAIGPRLSICAKVDREPVAVGTRGKAGRVAEVGAGKKAHGAAHFSRLCLTTVPTVERSSLALHPFTR
jgi:hypothetical protein